MTLGLAFWIVMLLWLVLGGWWSYSSGPWPSIAGWGIPFILFLILGWAQFGAPIHG